MAVNDRCDSSGGNSGIELEQHRVMHAAVGREVVRDVLGANRSLLGEAAGHGCPSLLS